MTTRGKRNPGVYRCVAGSVGNRRIARRGVGLLWIARWRRTHDCMIGSIFCGVSVPPFFYTILVLFLENHCGHRLDLYTVARQEGCLAVLATGTVVEGQHTSQCHINKNFGFRAKFFSARKLVWSMVSRAAHTHFSAPPQGPTYHQYVATGASEGGGAFSGEGVGCWCKTWRYLPCGSQLHCRPRPLVRCFGGLVWCVLIVL